MSLFFSAFLKRIILENTSSFCSRIDVEFCQSAIFLTFSFSFFILLFTKWRTWSIVDIPIFLLGIPFFGATDLPNPLNPQWNNSSLPNIKPKPKTVSWVWSPVLPTCLRVWLFYFPHPTKAEEVEEKKKDQKEPVLYLKSTNTPRKKIFGQY